MTHANEQVEVFRDFIILYKWDWIISKVDDATSPVTKALRSACNVVSVSKLFKCENKDNRG